MTINKDIKDYFESLGMVYKTNTLYAITHNGTMHADEISASTFIAKLAIARIMDFKLIRTLSIPEFTTDNVILYDLGQKYDPECNQFDHHQFNKPMRDDDIPYSSSGLVWKEYGKEILREYYHIPENYIDEVWKQIDTRIVVPIDRHDNGDDCFSSISICFKMMNHPKPNDHDVQRTNFEICIAMFSVILDNQVDNIFTKLVYRNILEPKLKANDKCYVALDSIGPWKEIVCDYNDNNPDDKCLYIIYPSNRGGYNIQVVPMVPYEMASWVDLPSEWISNPPKGCRFVHNNLFLAAFDTLENAIAAAETL